MKPTEADIQAELIEGWEIAYFRSHWLEIRSSITRISFWKHLEKIGLLLNMDNEKHSYADSPYTDFLNGNYDLSAISQHYEPEEWQRIITMCESIVRLITGEQVEQTLEEKVREILEPLGVTEIKVEPSVVTCVAGCAKREIVTTGVINHHPMNGSCCHDKFDTFESKYADAYRKVAALLTEQPEQTLEEAVRGHLAKITNCQVELVSCNYDKVEFISQSSDKLKTRHLNTVSKDYIYSCGTEYTVQEFKESNCYSSWIEALIPIAEELRSINRKPVSRSTKPSYSDLEQRVEELESELSEKGTENCELREEIDRLKESKRQIAETKSRILENYNQLASVDGQKTERITDLEAQLQDYISPADYEAEIKKLNALISDIDVDLTKARNEAARNLRWFHREYAKNAEASK